VISVRDEAMAAHRLSTVYAACLREYAAILRSMDLRRREELFDVGLERFAIHSAFEHKGCGNPLVTQCRDEGNGLPVSVQHFLDEPFTLRCSAVQTCNRRRHAGFIDEYKPSRIKLSLRRCNAVRAAATPGRSCSAARKLFLKGSFK
jgi:hypothetical protein